MRFHRPLVALVVLVALATVPLARAQESPEEGEFPAETPDYAALAQYAALARYIDTTLVPIPDGNPVPLGGSSGGTSAFGRALPRVELWNPPGVRRVGIQAGHYEHANAPKELGSVRFNPGAPGGGRIEWEVNLDLAERTADLLRAQGIEVDILPATIPIRYRAHAFLSIHADGSTDPSLRGYKVARPGFSSIPEIDDRYAEIMHRVYGQVSGLPDDSVHISRRMINYYAFNSRRYQHAVAPGVPQLILEAAFMSSPVDRTILFNEGDRLARAIAQGLMEFLDRDLTLDAPP